MATIRELVPETIETFIVIIYFVVFFGKVVIGISRFALSAIMYSRVTYSLVDWASSNYRGVTGTKHCIKSSRTLVFKSDLFLFVQSESRY